VDLTPHLVTGAALAVRVKRPSTAIVYAIVGHFVLDAIPHFHVVWLEGRALFVGIDIGLGILLTAVIAWRARRAWALVGAVVAVLPDAPGVREYWGLPMSHVLPHPTWDPPWGVVTQVVVATLAFLWGMYVPVTVSLPPRRTGADSPIRELPASPR
jgi:hypothetical protein